MLKADSSIPRSLWVHRPITPDAVGGETSSLQAVMYGTNCLKLTNWVIQPQATCPGKPGGRIVLRTSVLLMVGEYPWEYCTHPWSIVSAFQTYKGWLIIFSKVHVIYLIIQASYFLFMQHDTSKQHLSGTDIMMNIGHRSVPGVSMCLLGTLLFHSKVKDHWQLYIANMKFLGIWVLAWLDYWTTTRTTVTAVITIIIIIRNLYHTLSLLNLVHLAKGMSEDVRQGRYVRDLLARHSRASVLSQRKHSLCTSSCWCLE